MLLAIAGIGIGASCSSLRTTQNVVADQTNSTADPDIESAKMLVAKSPDSPAAHSQLAVQYIKAARRTGDFNLNAKALEAVNRAREIAPDDTIARKLEASLMLTFHRFSEGLEIGTKLHAENPKDPFVYGILTDANAELGNYKEAVEWAQKMVDLRPDSSSYARVAHMRSLHGDHTGAVNMYTLAARTADPTDKEAQAWCLTQLGSELWRYGQYETAAMRFEEALAILPDYPLALTGIARNYASRGDLASAATNLERANKIAPHTDTVILLGDIYTLTGNSEQAKAQYQLAENGEKELGDLHDAHRIALYWADNEVNLDEAVSIAREDHAKQKDLYASDTLAWALYKKGELVEAKKIIGEAMRLGMHDARVLYHAGVIETALGNKEEGTRLLKLAQKLNAEFDPIQSRKLKQLLS